MTESMEFRKVLEEVQVLLPRIFNVVRRFISSSSPALLSSITSVDLFDSVDTKIVQKNHHKLIYRILDEWNIL